MKGFAQDALIMFPKMESYTNCSPEYKNLFHESVERVYTLLSTYGIKPHVFVADELFSKFSREDVTAVLPLGAADIYFLRKETDLPIPDSVLSFPFNTAEEARKILDRTKLTVDATVDERFQVTLKRLTKCQNLLIKEYPIVIAFVKPNNRQFKKHVSRDGQLYIEISMKDLRAEAFISNRPVNMTVATGIPNATVNVFEWSV